MSCRSHTHSKHLQSHQEFITLTVILGVNCTTGSAYRFFSPLLLLYFWSKINPLPRETPLAYNFPTTLSIPSLFPDWCFLPPFIWRSCGWNSDFLFLVITFVLFMIPLEVRTSPFYFLSLKMKRLVVAHLMCRAAISRDFMVHNRHLGHLFHLSNLPTCILDRPGNRAHTFGLISNSVVPNILSLGSSNQCYPLSTILITAVYLSQDILSSYFSQLRVVPWIPELLSLKWLSFYFWCFYICL